MKATRAAHPPIEQVSLLDQLTDMRRQILDEIGKQTRKLNLISDELRKLRCGGDPEESRVRLQRYKVL